MEKKYVGYVLDMRTREVLIATKVFNSYNSAAIAVDRERFEIFRLMQDESLRLDVSIELEKDEFEWS